MSAVKSIHREFGSKEEKEKLKKVLETWVFENILLELAIELSLSEMARRNGYRIKELRKDLNWNI